MKRSNEASFTLWNAFNEQANFVASPYGIRSALGLVYLASEGQALRALRDALRYSSQGLATDFGLIDSAATGRDHGGFRSESALWAARNMTVRSSFAKTVSEKAGASLHVIDFASDPAAAVRAINRWVSERTGGHISSVLGPGDVKAQTKAIFANAVYFKGRWLVPFDREQTRSRPFRTLQGSSAMVETMAGGACKFVAADGHRAALVAYGDTSIVFAVVVPEVWANFQWSLSEYSALWAALQQGRQGELELPKFRLRSRRNLTEPLAGLGVSMSDAGLLKKMFANDQAMAIDDAVHEAFVRVDETSTEAAATTVVTSVPEEEAPLPPVFRVDQPFYFMLVERRTGLILLMGQVTDPSQLEN